ncbi:GA module-containing protein, partial [Salmonella enterica subsp. enterica serovar Typhimurium]|nr:GA module-containing protein [Salmonella enterica subsp. enterica serovar Typhimurium]
MIVDNFSKDDNLIELQTTSQYNPIIDTNISFYESDRGTGVLNFAVTKNNRPLSISSEHVKTSIVLKTDDYNVDRGAYDQTTSPTLDPTVINQAAGQVSTTKNALNGNENLEAAKQQASQSLGSLDNLNN